ncbi:MAG: S41 family peptidase [Candidatus Paceibacterota bacterium]|jgi:carboxyl-terminal processing protease
MNYYRRFLYIGLSLLLLGGFFFSGVYVGYQHRPSITKIQNIDNIDSKNALTNADFEPFWKVWNLINEKYPNAVQTSDQARVWGAIAGLTNSLNDPYTTFFPPEDSKSFQEIISGQFGGLGMEVGIKDKILTIIAPLKGTPADYAGLKSGDKILKIDDKITSDLTIDAAIKLMRGEKGTSVTLAIFRDGEENTREIKIVRDIIMVPTIDTEARKDGIFVIRLYSFSANAANLFRDALREFIQSGDNKLILDLRGNPGGYLDIAVDMASWFLPIGKTIVSEDYGVVGKEDVYSSKGYDIFNDNLKFVILVDGGSASASEILAGALSEHHVAKLVGEKTYGKGSVQELVDITPTTSLKITVAKWLTPNGISISSQGITPDFIIPITEKDIDAKRDPQMDKAVELLNK